MENAVQRIKLIYMNILKFLIVLAGGVVIAFSQEVNYELLKKGYEVYKNYCSLCHMEKASLLDFLKARLYVLSGKRPENIDAPPMNLVSARIKEFYPNELEFIEFVKDYITNPSKEKGVCKPAAYSFFGIMPPIGQDMTEEEKEAVAYWMYYRYSDNWQELFQKVKELQKKLTTKK